MVDRVRYFSSCVDRNGQREGALTSRGARLSYSVKMHKHIDGGDDSTWPLIELCIHPHERSARAQKQNGWRGSHGALGVAVIRVARCVATRGAATDLLPCVGGFVKQGA